MNDKTYEREQGEFELRVLKDGRLVMIAPDENLLEIARTLTDRNEPSDTPAGGTHAER